MTTLYNLLEELDQADWIPGKYSTILVDPPWPMKKMQFQGKSQSPSEEIKEYKTMSLEEIENLRIPSLVDPRGCHLYLWTTQRFLPDAIKLVRHWGFKYHCVLTWIKIGKNHGMTPFTFNFSTEFLVFGIHNNLQLLKIGEPIHLVAPSIGHSCRPNAMYDLIERVSPEPRVELFARDKRPGWTAWGDEL